MVEWDLDSIPIASNKGPTVHGPSGSAVKHVVPVVCLRYVVGYANLNYTSVIGIDATAVCAVPDLMELWKDASCRSSSLIT